LQVLRPQPYAEIEQSIQMHTAWSKEQDEELKKLFGEGLKVITIDEKISAKRGGITARLEKLGLIEK